jgi:hypothetical protein
MRSVECLVSKFEGGSHLGLLIIGRENNIQTAVQEIVHGVWNGFIWYRIRTIGVLF